MQARAKVASPARLKSAREFFRLHPDDKIPTGIWTDPTWTREQFLRWFLSCLHAKINREIVSAGRKHTEEYQLLQSRDAQRVRESRRGIRRRGRNLLDTPEFKRWYPEVDNSELED